MAVNIGVVICITIHRDRNNLFVIKIDWIHRTKYLGTLRFNTLMLLHIGYVYVTGASSQTVMVFTHTCFLRDKQIRTSGISEGKWTGINTKHTDTCPRKYLEWSAVIWLSGCKMIPYDIHLNQLQATQLRFSRVKKDTYDQFIYIYDNKQFIYHDGYIPFMPNADLKKKSVDASLTSQGYFL